MSQTQPNGVITITNDEVYDLSLHQARLAKSIKSVHACANAAARDGLAALYGGTLPVPTLVHRADLDGYETWNGSSWVGVPASYLETAPAGYTWSGTVTVEPRAGKKLVTVDLTILKETSSVAITTTYTGLGSPIPSAARSASVPIKYFSASITGGGMNVIAGAGINPTDGSAFIRGTSAFTWAAGGLFTINCSYYI